MMEKAQETAVDKAVEVVVKKDDLSVLQEVGDELGISVSVLKKEREEYLLGQKDKVGLGCVYVRIDEASGESNDLSEFWAKVEEKKASK